MRIQDLLIMMAFMLSTLAGCSAEKSADLLLTNGRIYTVDTENRVVDAVAVQDGKILCAGSAEEAARFQGAKTKVIDLQGATVLPGLVDAHGHLFSLGNALSIIDLVGTTGPQQIQAKVLEALQDTPPGRWVQGRGWDQNDWEVQEFPTWRDLSGTESHPVFLRRVDGHAAWANRRALDMAGITAATPDTAGGKIMRDAQGNPTGVLIDNAIYLVRNHIPLPTQAEREEWLDRAVARCHSVGLVGIHDAGVDSAKMNIYLERDRAGSLNFRVYAMLDDGQPDFVQDWLERGQYHSPHQTLTVRSIKLYADGALGSRGAALLEPYADDPGNAGLLVNSDDYLYEAMRQAHTHGFQVCTHAIGDRGNRKILDLYERILSEYPVADHRFRIEHAQMLSPSDIPRFTQLDVIPSMQPTHATSDMYWAEDRTGPQRSQGLYAWRQLLDSGCRIPCGSDVPVESPDPLWGIYAAVTRQDHQGWPTGGWHPEERMTVLEAVRGFTIDAAYARFMDDIAGSIEPGKLADFTVLDRDIFDLPPAEILNTKVVYTIVGGKDVYTNAGTP